MGIAQKDEGIASISGERGASILEYLILIFFVAFFSLGVIPQLAVAFQYQLLSVFNPDLQPIALMGGGSVSNNGNDSTTECEGGYPECLANQSNEDNQELPD